MATSRSTDSNAFAAALRVLTRCDRTEAELRNKLRQFGFAASTIDAAVEKCYAYAYLDDRRYALERARMLLRTGRGAGQKILFELRKRGIADTIATEALEIASADVDSAELLREQLARRFPDFHYASADEKQRRRVVSYFQRRGFALGEIFTILKTTET